EVRAVDKKYTSDFDRTGWTIDTSDEATRHLNIVRLIRRTFHYIADEPAIRDTLLKVGTAESKTVEYRDNRWRDKATKRSLTFDQAYESFQNESRKTRQYLLTGLEISLLLGGGA